MNIENELQKNNFYDIKKIADSKAYSFFYISHKLKVKGFLVLPKKLKKKNNPLIFVCRGGTRDFCMIKKENLNMYDFLIKAGYVVCLTQYRGVDGGEGEDLMGGRRCVRCHTFDRANKKSFFYRSKKNRFVWCV